MSTVPNAVEEAVRLWELARQGTVAELENIAEEQWDYRAGEGARSVREVAMHIAGSSAGFVNELLSPDTQFSRMRDPKVQADLASSLGDAKSKDEVVALLKSRGAGDLARLRAGAEALEAGRMTSMTGEQSRVAGLWFAVAHEMYHRGQLTVYARAVGVEPAMTQRLRGPAK
jgi:uncharacterized damage-inducible protein DinB